MALVFLPDLGMESGTTGESNGSCDCLATETIPPSGLLNTGQRDTDRGQIFEFSSRHKEARLRRHTLTRRYSHLIHFGISEALSFHVGIWVSRSAPNPDLRGGFPRRSSRNQEPIFGMFDSRGSDS